MKPDFIRSWSEIEAPAAPPHAAEDFGFASELSAAAGINHFRVAHLRIPPGRRAYPPMAMDDLEIFSFVLEGAPDLWADGHLYRLEEGDGVVLNARTGLSHTLINNTPRDARLLVMTEAFRRNSRAHHPMDQAANENLHKMGMLWSGAPKRRYGPSDGKPGSTAGRKRARPGYVAHWQDILNRKAARYPDSDEDQGLSAPFGNHARFSRIGIHLEVLKPGRRTSYPHAERDEDEFVYVVAGKVDAWNDGHIVPVGEGGFIGWPGGTGITHVIINNSDADAVLLVGGEASRAKNKFWYPYHPSRNKAAAKNYWDDHPAPKLGPHDGLPDTLREKLPLRARRNALAANTAALNTATKRR